jgi:diacylglycerol O-acyltransferase
MERLRGIDAGYLYMETPTVHMHTLKVALLDPSTVPGGYSFDRFKEELSKRLHLLPPFRRRLVDIPFGLHHPVWIEDPDFDIDNHVHHSRVSAPGGSRQMDEAIGVIAGRQLDRRRPLWEVHLLEGLADGSIAFVTKIHHTAADGVAAAAMLANVMSTSADEGDPPPPITPWEPEPVPSPWRLVADAVLAWFGDIHRLPGLLARTLGGTRAVARHRREAEVVPPRPIVDVANASFNAALTPNRTFATVSLSLDDLKRVKRAFGVTLNDVVLAVVSGSLRHYLEGRGEPVDRPLVAGVPVSTDRPEDAPRLSGNKVSNMFTSLRDDIDDPVERLRAISAVTKSAKVVQNLLGVEMMEDWVEYTPPRPFAFFLRQYSRFRLADRHRPPMNLVVSNVPGPRTPFFVTGARLLAIYSVGPILDGIGLNITVWSYLDRMNFAAIACPEAVPDLHAVTDGLASALAELVTAAEAAERSAVSPEVLGTGVSAIADDSTQKIW